MNTEFNADKARELVYKKHFTELDDVLIKIKTEAENGKTVLHVNKPINEYIKNQLIDRGFEVKDAPSIGIQRDNIFCLITW